jgi:hypothetical protein
MALHVGEVEGERMRAARPVGAQLHLQPTQQRTTPAS